MRTNPVRLLGRRRPPASVAASPTEPGPHEALVPSPEFDEGRQLHDKGFYSLCYAPSVSLFFDQHGDVRACNQNLTGVLGNIRLHSIREIWEGEQATALRAALARRDLGRGCNHCQWQQENGDSAIRFSRTFDTMPVPEPLPQWPRMMEFSLTNACNLQCEMCTGWNSSSIRAHREGLPPLPVPYGDEFFAELAEFLPHLDHVTLLGGEPFLGGETLRLLEMIAELPHRPSVFVTTNGTQWTPRVQRICERVPMSFEVSIDGATAETFEHIRIGARFEAVVENLDRYAAVARAHDTRIGISHCLMPSNWHEFLDLLLLAEAHDLDFVSVNVVTFPPAFSLYRLPTDELREVVATLDRLDATRADELTTMRPVWDEQLHALRRRLDERAAPVPGDVGSDPLTVPWDGGRSPQVELARQALADWDPDVEVSVLRGDASLVATSIDGPLLDVLGGNETDHLGVTMSVIVDRIGAALGVELAPTHAVSGLPNDLPFVGVSDGRVRIELRSFLFRDGDDLVSLVGIRTVV